MDTMGLTIVGVLLVATWMLIVYFDDDDNFRFRK